MEQAGLVVLALENPLEDAIDACRIAGGLARSGHLKSALELYRRVVEDSMLRREDEDESLRDAAEELFTYAIRASLLAARELCAKAVELARNKPCDAVLLFEGVLGTCTRALRSEGLISSDAFELADDVHTCALRNAIETLPVALASAAARAENAQLSSASKQSTDTLRDTLHLHTAALEMCSEFRSTRLAFGATLAEAEELCAWTRQCSIKLALAAFVRVARHSSGDFSELQLLREIVAACKHVVHSSSLDGADRDIALKLHRSALAMLTGHSAESGIRT